MGQLHDVVRQLTQALFDLTLWSALIQLAGALVICRAVIRGAWVLLRGAPVEQARVVVANGILSGLNFTLAATLLNSILVHSWLQLLTFGAVVVFRFVLGRLFQWERARALEMLPATTGT